MDKYDRMKPFIWDLLDRLQAYSQVDYGTEAYPLSKAEALVILAEIEYL